MSTKYEPLNIVEFGGGMVTVQEANRIKDNEAVFAQNIEIGSGGGIGPRKGSTLFGQNLTSAGKIISGHTMRLRDGTEIPMRLREDTDNTKAILEWYNAVAAEWELLVDSLNQTARMKFINWNTSSDDRVYFGNGKENYSKWLGVISVVVSNTSTTLTLKDASDFPNSDTVVVDGAEFAYSSKSGNILSGLTGLPTFTVDEGVALKADTTSFSSVTKTNVMIAHLSRMWIGKNSVMEYSKTGDPENFTVPGTRVPGDPGTEDFPEGGGDITGFASRDNLLIVMKKDVLRTFFFNQLNIGTDEIPVSQPLGFSHDIGPHNAASVTTWLKEVFYVSQNDGLRQLTQVLAATQGETPVLDVLDLNDAIRPTIADFDMDDAATVAHDRKILAAVKSETGAIQDTIIVYDFRTKGIVLYKGWAANDWFHYLGDLYFCSAAEPNTFKAFDGFTDNGSPISCLFRTKKFDFGEPAMQKEMPLIFVEGLIGDGTDIETTVSRDGPQDRGQTTKTIRSTGKYVVKTPPPALGEKELGVEPLSGTIADVGELNKFRVYLTQAITYHFNFDIIFRVESEGGRWKITTIAPNPSLQKQPISFLKI